MSMITRFTGGTAVTTAGHPGAVSIRPADWRDRDHWIRMRCDLWPDGTLAEHAGEVDAFFAGTLKMPLAVLVALNRSGDAIGFVELSIRAYAEDCVTDRVAYLEGWYVVPYARRHGVGRALVAAAEAWGREQGCTEFGSDALLGNEPSAAAHRALGFDETVQIRCFKKLL